jgi:hypothetical protein
MAVLLIMGQIKERGVESEPLSRNRGFLGLVTARVYKYSFSEYCENKLSKVDDR